MNVASAGPSAALLLVFQLHPKVEIFIEILMFFFRIAPFQFFHPLTHLVRLIRLQILVTLGDD